MLTCRRIVLTCLLLLGMISGLRALENPLSFTFDLPFASTQTTPAWMGQPQLLPTLFATLDLPITPPDPKASLLVTVFFQEKSGGFLRISWQSALNPEVLSDNFFEGIGMSNQRSLLITADEMKQAGSLRFQCGDQQLDISRIKLEWLQGATGLASPSIKDVVVTPADGASKFAADLAGDPKPADEAAWHDRLVNVPITEAPLRIEQGVDFSVELDTVPATARLALKESGLPVGEHLVLWVNNHRVSTVSPSAPDLADAGYPADKQQPYVGWREGTILVPVSAFTPGANALQFSAEPDDTTSTPLAPSTGTAAQAVAPLALKDVALQLDYPATSKASAANSGSPSTMGAGAAANAVPEPPTSELPNLPDATSSSPASGASDLLTPGAYAQSVNGTPPTTNAAPQNSTLP